MCLILGCGDDNVTEVVSPKVTQTYPEDGATDVNLFTEISIWFSRDMDEASLDSIYVGDMTNHSVDYSGSEKMATVLVDSMLKPGTLYEVRVVSYVMDTDGNKLAADYEFSFTTGPFDCAHLQDRFEPNDDITTATPVELDTHYPRLSTCGGQERRDLFRFTVTDTVKVTAMNHVSHSDSNKANFLVEFLRSDGAELTAAGMLGNVPGNMDWWRTFLPGTYYLSTGKYHDDQYIVAYDLVLETSEPCQDDEFEDNDLFDEAAPMTPGSYPGLRGCKVDEDYYSLELTGGQTLTVTYAQTSTPEKLRRLTIYDEGERELLRRQESTSPTVGTLTIPSTGTYYIGFFFWNDDITYDLDIEVSGP
jgi:hypothetical protein